jgi:ActR/RegA family two-component response regulator
MSLLPPVPASRRRPDARGSSPSLTVLAIVSDPAVRELMTRVLRFERLLITEDFAEGLALASVEVPDVAFIDLGIGDGAGLTLVHHLKALVPDVSIYALASRKNLDAAASAVSLGGTGLLMLPLSGDDVLSAIWGIKQRIVERSERERLERVSAMSARATGWTARVAEIADAEDRQGAAGQLVELLVEVTGALGAAVYLVGDGPRELILGAASPSLEGAPAKGSEKQILESFAAPRRLLALPLASRNVSAGYALLLEGDLSPVSAANGADPPIDGIIRLLATVAATALAMLAERERAERVGATIKDPTSSAYSFAYYVDVAGREISRARRYGRRFAIVTAVAEGLEGVEPCSPTELADRLLETAHDTDVLARVDENEFHLLLPETSGLGVHACRRRIMRSGDRGPSQDALLVGGAAFPHDGQDLGKLLRVARLRAEASKTSVVHRLDPEQTTVPDLLEALVWETASAAPARQTAAVRPLELALTEAEALVHAVVSDALRGGGATIVVTHNPELSLGVAVRTMVAQNPDDGATVHAIDLHTVPGCERIEALVLIAEHGAYALLARNEDGVLRGAHAADPLLADVLAERLGRAAGVRVFG